MARALPSNAELAEQFELLADLLELDGADAFRLSAYRRAATRIRESAVPVAQLALDNKATRLSGIGTTIENKIVEYTETGDLAALAKLRDRAPDRAGGGHARARARPEDGAQALDGARRASEADLRAAAEQGRLSDAAGPRPEDRGESACEPRQAEAESSGRRCSDACSRRSSGGGGAARSTPPQSESPRRAACADGCETVRDLDIIATAAIPGRADAHFAALPWVAEVVAQGSTKTTVVSHDGLRFDLRVVPPESYGNLLQHFTGSKAHNVALREEAVGRGLSVSEYGVKNIETGEVVHAADEEELYKFLGYAWIPPELRENRGELAAARDRRPADASSS